MIIDFSVSVSKQHRVFDTRKMNKEGKETFDFEEKSRDTLCADMVG